MNNSAIDNSLITQTPLVSLIICTYNGEEFLEQALRSATSQTYRNIEIIVVDDGSCDRTREILKAAEQQDKRIRVFMQRNRGLPYARNVAFSKAKGDWIAIIDQDDLCYRSRVEEQVARAGENRDIRFFFCNTDYINIHGQIVGNHVSNFPGIFSRRIKENDAANLLLRLGCFVASQSFFIHRSLIQEVGSLNETLTYTCDYDFFIRAGLIADFLYINKSLAAWRLHPNQATVRNSNKRAELIKIYRRYLFFPNIQLSVRLYLSGRIARLSLSRIKSYLKKGK